MERSDERAARNESLFREANEQIDGRRDALGVDAKTPYICECSREGCMEVVLLSPDDYSEVRAEPTRFLQKPGHAEGSEHVVAERDGYVIVEKLGASAQTAREEA